MDHKMSELCWSFQYIYTLFMCFKVNFTKKDELCDRLVMGS